MSKSSRENTIQTAESEAIYAYGLLAHAHQPTLLGLSGQAIQYLHFSAAYSVAYSSLHNSSSLWQFLASSSSQNAEHLAFLAQHGQINQALLNPVCFLPFRYGTTFQSVGHLEAFLVAQSEELTKKCQQVEGMYEYSLSIIATQTDTTPSKTDGKAFFMHKYKQFKRESEQKNQLQNIQQQIDTHKAVVFTELQNSAIKLLIAASNAGLLKAALTQAMATQPPDLRVRVSGPWPVSTQNIEDLCSADKI